MTVSISDKTTGNVARQAGGRGSTCPQSSPNFREVLAIQHLYPEGKAREVCTAINIPSHLHTSQTSAKLNPSTDDKYPVPSWNEHQHEQSVPPAPAHLFIHSEKARNMNTIIAHATDTR